MSGESPKKIGCGYERNLEAGQFQPMIDSWELHLRAERKSAKTVRTYLEAAQWFAAGYLIPAGLADWDEVKAKHVQEWIITLLGRYSDSYANNQFRALQQFFRWHATEDPDEPRPNPMASLKPPSRDKLVPVFTDDELAALLDTCKGGGFQNRRDYAIISLFKDTGARLSELAGLDDGRRLTARARGRRHGQGRQAVDDQVHLRHGPRARPLPARARQAQDGPGGRAVAGSARRPMTASGVYQMIERRGREAGVEVNPHKFRHTFSHVFLDRGGAEGDLMELNGWTSPQMLARYGRSARGARARRHYDDVMGA